eukprot:2972572-Pleurochrysis_carterae.AAC.1
MQCAALALFCVSQLLHQRASHNHLKAEKRRCQNPSRRCPPTPTHPTMLNLGCTGLSHVRWAPRSDHILPPDRSARVCAG